MKFKLEIECDNEAFEEDAGNEIARILHVVAYRVPPEPPFELPLYDVNGNHVGFAKFED